MYAIGVGLGVTGFIAMLLGMVTSGTTGVVELLGGSVGALMGVLLAVTALRFEEADSVEPRP